MNNRLERLTIQLNELDTQFSSRLLAAVKYAVTAGQQTLTRFQDDQLEVIKKADQSPVTVADTEAELLLRKCIADDFPEDAILGEEFSDVAGSTGYRWILDPIDGTKSFISGVPLYATLIGIEQEGSSQVGVIYIPALDELIFAEIGKGARYCRGAAKMTEPKVSQVATLADACFVTTQISTYDECNRRQVFRDIEQQASITRTWGDAYGYLLVATGRAEVMIDPIFNVWDGAAILPVIQEAGGTFTDWKGVTTVHNQEGIATNGYCHNEILAFTRNA
ncbi:MAG: histidinol-phosphatase [Planctomycetota bacterium]|nr:histidinol-phosphatase [Planctomycetota bacterium]